MIDEIVINKFKKITNYQIGNFLIDSKEFFQKDYVAIVTFFEGKSNTLNKIHIKKLNELCEQSLIIANIFHNKKNLMKTVDFWHLLNAFEDIKTKLQTTINISRYLRSSIVANKTKSGFAFEYDLKYEQNLELVARKLLRETNYENNWTDIAIENDLKEIDYDVSGGTNLKLSKRLFQANLVTSMIDNTIGEKIYGRDIKKLFEYKNNDLDSLGYKETVYQTAEILSGLEKGDIPEFPQLGLNSAFYKGVNMSQLNYPSIVREMMRNFSTDDLFQNFEIKDFKIVEGDIHINYKIDTKYDLVLIKNVVI